jgi:hypothetical protein
MSCLQCDLPELLERSCPPDPDLVDLIEQAFLVTPSCRGGQKASAIS